MSDAPPTYLPDDAPEELKAAERTLRKATNQLLLMAERIELWKALFTDDELHERLGPSYAGSAAFTVLTALQDAIVLGLARMFDKDGQQRSLDLDVPMDAITKPANVKWLCEHREANHRAMPVHNAGGHSLSEEEFADVFRQVAEFRAQHAGGVFAQRMAAFIEARRNFEKGEVSLARKRLVEMRNKEVAHTDLQPTWKNSRPRVDDLQLVFDAVRRLVWTANMLCTGVDHRDLRNLTRPEAVARCFAAVLRRETFEEHRTAEEAAFANAPKDAEFSWDRQATEHRHYDCGGGEGESSPS